MPNRDSSSSNPRTFGWFRAATARGGFFAPRGSSSRTPAPFGPVRRRLARRSLPTAVGSTSKFRSRVDDFLIALTVRYSSIQVGLDQQRGVTLYSLCRHTFPRTHARTRKSGHREAEERATRRNVRLFSRRCWTRDDTRVGN